MGRSARSRKRGGMAFDQCPVWWLRWPAEFPGAAPPGVAGQHVVEFIEERDAAMQAGGLGFWDELPARLATGIAELRRQMRLREDNARFAQEQNQKRQAEAQRHVR